MKILQVTNKVPFPAKDGGAIACLNLSTGFSVLGHEVTILTMNTLKHHVSLEEIPASLRDLVDFRFVNVPAKIKFIPAVLNLTFSNKPYNATRFISNSFRSELINLLKEKQFDLIQLEGLYVLPYIPDIRMVTSVPVVYRAHNIEHEIWQRTSEISRGFTKWYTKILAKRIKRFEKELLNTYDLIVPITDRDRNILNSMGNRKPSHVSQTGIDASVLIPNAKKLEFPSLFHIGSLEWSPNQEGLIWFIEKCWTKLHEKFPDLKFFVAGRNAPNWLIRKLNEPNVVFEGEVNDAYEFINSKSVMIVPLFSGSGMRIKIIEGMALGKPIVTTTIGTEGIATTPGLNILIADNETDFIDSVSKLVTDREFNRTIGRNAIEYIHKEFDNLAAASALIEFYKTHIQ